MTKPIRIYNKSIVEIYLNNDNRLTISVGIPMCEHYYFPFGTKILSDPGYPKQLLQLLVRKSRYIKNEIYNVMNKGVTLEHIKFARSGIYFRNKMIPYAFALVSTYPNISHKLIYDHLLTTRYLADKEDQDLMNMMDSDYTPENHETILADFARKLRRVSINKDTFKINRKNLTMS